VLVVLLAGSGGLAPGVQIAAAAAAAMVVALVIVGPEAGNAQTALNALISAGRVAWIGSLVAMVATAVLALVLWSVVWPAIDFFQRHGGLATLAFTLGVVILWPLAVALRLASYATTWLRVAVALLLAVAIAGIAARGGLFPGYDGLFAHASGVIPGTVVEVALGLVCLDAALTIVGEAISDANTSKFAVAIRKLRAIQSGALTAPKASRAAGAGFALALGAAAMLGMAIAIGLYSSSFGGNDRVTPGDEVIRPESPAIAPGSVPDDFELAKTFMPVLSFTEHERWSPIAVDSYVSSARLIGPGVGMRYPTFPRTPDQLPRACPPRGPAACYQLTIGCPDVSAPCAAATHRPVGRRSDGAAYYRVVRRPRTGPPGVFADLGPYRADLSILIQYWFFYRYDLWEAAVLGGELTQRHEGDWEAVMVGLSSTQPLFVAYSEHCGGIWRSWKDIDAAASQRPWTHPLVAVAEGSQANYPKADQRRSPDWAGCAGVPPGTATLISYASNVRDRTDYGPEWTPAELIRGDEKKPPMSFPGTWGANDRTSLENLRSLRLGKEGSGPRSPPLQPLWQQPVRTVFCSEHWEPRQCGS
jgi:hypothetical protein